MPDPATELVPPPYRCRRRRRWIILGCLLILGVVFGRFAYRRITLRPTPRPAYWEAQLAALDPPPPETVPTAEILRLITQPAWATDPAITSLTQFRLDQPLQGPWNPPREETTAVSLAFANDAAREDRRSILGLLETGWPEPISLDPNKPMPWPRELRGLGQWLLVHSRWAREEAADPATATEDWLAALRVARQLRRPPTALHLCYEAGLVAETAQEMALAAGEGVIPRNTRDLAERCEQILGPPRDARDLLAGDRLAQQCELEFVFVREGGHWLDVAEAVRLRGAMIWGWFYSVGPLKPTRMWNLTSPLFRDLPETAARLERYWSELEKPVDLISCQQVNEYLEAHPEFGSTAADGSLRDPYGEYYAERTVVSARYGSRCCLDAALTMLALAACVERNEHYPETLDELIPDFLPRLPVDYADRKPLRYRRTEQGYVLYSIGVDGKDDNGWPGIRGSPSFGPEPGDVVFSAIRREPVNP